MIYQDTLDYLFSQLPMYQRSGAAAYKEDIGNIIKACDILQDPHKKFKSIHIAGTNGKGSTAHMLASILQEAGFKAGLYTSPHLKDFRERIKINGKMISKDQVIDFVIDRYGEYVLLNPKISFENLILWLSGPFFLIIGGIIGWRYTRQKNKESPKSLNEKEKKRLDEILND